MINKVGAAMVAKKQGTIINIGSAAAIDVLADWAVYCASKFGMRGFHLASYEEFRKHNVKVMLINPSFVKTEMVVGIEGNRDRMMEPSDIAEVALTPFRTSVACCPVELVLRLQLDPFEK
eukprot:Platyproteum_vivax@DN7580_c0_g1_i3.p1